MGTKQIEVLVFDGCPNLDSAIERVREAMRLANVAADLRVVRVESDDDAKRLHFLGSPTVRVDGVDVEPGSIGREDCGLQCRIYSVAGRHQGTPPADWIAAALCRDQLDESEGPTQYRLSARRRRAGASSSGAGRRPWSSRPIWTSARRSSTSSHNRHGFACYHDD